MSGTVSRIWVTAGMKPRSAMWSASSSTVTLDSAEVDHALVHQVDQPPRRRDHDVHAPLERPLLRRVGHAAGDQRDRLTRTPGQRRQHLGDLHGQLAGGREHQTAGRATPAQVTVGQAGQHREPEGEGLAGPGLRPAEDVLAAHRRRDGGRLDGERGRDTRLGQCGDQAGRQTEVSETAQPGRGRRAGQGRWRRRRRRRPVGSLGPARRSGRLRCSGRSRCSNRCRCWGRSRCSNRIPCSGRSRCSNRGWSARSLRSER